MKPRISLITLGVHDLDRSLAFYRDGLGLNTQGIVGTEFEHGAVVFFDLQHGLKLALFPVESLIKDSGVEVSQRGAAKISLGHNVRTRDEVDQVCEQVRRAGAKIVKEPCDTFWGGYAAYFQDPDSYLWEVAWNPQMLPDN